MLIRFFQSEVAVNWDASEAQTKVVFSLNISSEEPGLDDQARFLERFSDGRGVQALARLMFAARKLPANPSIGMPEFESKQAVFDTGEGIEHCHPNTRVASETTTR